MAWLLTSEPPVGKISAAWNSPQHMANVAELPLRAYPSDALVRKIVDTAHLMEARECARIA